MRGIAIAIAALMALWLGSCSLLKTSSGKVEKTTDSSNASQPDNRPASVGQTARTPVVTTQSNQRSDGAQSTSAGKQPRGAARSTSKNAHSRGYSRGQPQGEVVELQTVETQYVEPVVESQYVEPVVVTQPAEGVVAQPTEIDIQPVEVIEQPVAPPKVIYDVNDTIVIPQESRSYEISPDSSVCVPSYNTWVDP